MVVIAIDAGLCVNAYISHIECDVSLYVQSNKERVIIVEKQLKMDNRFMNIAHKT